MEGSMAAVAGFLGPLSCALALCARFGRPVSLLGAFAAALALSRPLAALLEPALASALGGSWAAYAIAAAVPESALVALCAAASSRGAGGRAMWAAGAAAGLGLAAAEGISYGLAGGLGVAAARLLASVPAHAADGALAGGAAALLARRGWPPWGAWGAGWACALASHAAFDLLALSPASWGGDAAALSGWAACGLALWLLGRVRRAGQDGSSPS